MTTWPHCGHDGLEQPWGQLHFQLQLHLATLQQQHHCLTKGNETSEPSNSTITMSGFNPEELGIRNDLWFFNIAMKTPPFIYIYMIYIYIYDLYIYIWFIYIYIWLGKFFLTLDHFFLTLPLFFDLGSLFFDLGSLFLDLDLLFLNLGMFLLNPGLLSHTCLESCAILHFYSVCVWFWSV